MTRINAARRMTDVQPPIIPIVGDLIRRHPGTISLGQGVVSYGPPAAALKALEAFPATPDDHRYGPVEGQPELVAAIRRKLADENRVVVGDERRIVVTAGGNMAFVNAVLAVTDPGDEVILLTPFYFNHDMAIVIAGCRTVAVPTDASYQLRLDAIEEAITPRTRAVVTISIAGHPCRAAEIGAIAKRHDLPVIEDAAHSLTARIGDAPVGTQADITCFSFYATKGVTAGEGGMAVTARAEWADRIRRLCLHGLSDAAWGRYGKGGWWEYDVTELGFKYNLTDMQAALALAQLARADAMRARREEIARRYTAALRGVPGLTTPEVAPDVRHAWHLYQIAVAPGARMDRTALALALREEGIGTSVHFKPLHLFPWYQKLLGLRAGQCPVAEAAFVETLSLPIYPDLTDADVDRVAERIRAHLGG